MAIRIARVCAFVMILALPVCQVLSQLGNALQILTVRWWNNQLSRAISRLRQEKILAHLLVAKIFSRFFSLARLIPYGIINISIRFNFEDAGGAGRNETKIEMLSSLSTFTVARLNWQDESLRKV